MNSTKSIFNNKIANPVPRFVHWAKPPEGFVKLNFDGSALGNPGRAGFGGVVRSDSGEWIMGFSGFTGTGTNLFAELKRIQQGLHLLWDTEIWCVSLTPLMPFTWYRILCQTSINMLMFC